MWIWYIDLLYSLTKTCNHCVHIPQLPCMHMVGVMHRQWKFEGPQIITTRVYSCSHLCPESSKELLVLYICQHDMWWGPTRCVEEMIFVFDFHLFLHYKIEHVGRGLRIKYCSMQLIYTLHILATTACIKHSCCPLSHHHIWLPSCQLSQSHTSSRWEF